MEPAVAAPDGTPLDSSGPPPADPLADLAPPAPPPPKKRRRIGWIISVILLVLALGATGTLLWLTIQRLDEAKVVIEEQQELIEKKESFSSAMQGLVTTIGLFEGTRHADLVPLQRYESLAGRGWDHRWNGESLDRDTAEVVEATQELVAMLDAAKEQAAVNATGSAFEATIDQLSGGWVGSVIDDSDTLCESDVLGCVLWEDPYTVHFDAADNGQPWMTDFIRTGIAYHEYAHTLQMTNPEETETAAAAFGGDWETMADCYSLTYLPGWSLDHTVWVSSYEYWEISVGYGYTCNAEQQQVVRTWYDSLGIAKPTLEQ